MNSSNSVYGDLNGKAVCVLSGGLDSTVATVLASKHFDETHAITFFYGQKQSCEIECAMKTAKNLGIAHKMIDISFLGEIVSGVSSNIKGSKINVPTIKEVLGSPQPVTYVPNRNSILLNIAAAYAEANGMNTVITGLQTHDTYGYYDTTPEFVSSINLTWSQNRKNQVRLEAPFIQMSKKDELELLLKTVSEKEFDEFLKNTMTCYNPHNSKSCGKCPSCAERIYAFMQIGRVDPLEYEISINW